MEDTATDFQDLLAAFDIPDMRVKISEVRSLAPDVTSTTNMFPKTVTTSASASTPTVKQEPESVGDDCQSSWKGACLAESRDPVVEGSPTLPPPVSHVADLPLETPATVTAQEISAQQKEPTMNGDSMSSFAEPQQGTPSVAQHAKVVSSTLIANSWANSVSGSKNLLVSIAPKPGRADKLSGASVSQSRCARLMSVAASTQASGVITTPITACISMGLVNNKHTNAPPLVIGNHVQPAVKGKTSTIIVDVSSVKQAQLNPSKTITGYQILQVSSADLLKRVNPIPRFVPIFNQLRVALGGNNSKLGKMRYPCEECGDIFLVQSSLKLHMERRSVHIAFNCPFCVNNQSLTFYNKCSFHAHLRQHSKQGKLKINFASQAYSNATVSSLAFPKTSTQDKVVVSDVVKVPSSSEVHVTKSSAPSPTSSTKETEDLRSTATQLTSKASTGSTTIVIRPVVTEGVNSCPICLIRFTSESALQSHMQRYLPNQDVTCDACKMTLPNRCQLRMHSVMHSGVTSKWMCPECARPISDLKAFYCHISNTCMHWYRQMRVQCKLCSRMVSDYVQHLDKGHEMLFYRCVSCSMAFKTLPALKEHSERRHNIQPGSPLCRIISKCPFCETVFMQKPLLIAHIKMHIQQEGMVKSKAWVYCCPKCSTTFSHLINFKKHLVTSHPTLKHFHCDLCRRNFPSYEQLTWHFETGQKSGTQVVCLAAKLRNFKKGQDSMKSGEGITSKPSDTSKALKLPDTGKKEEQPVGKLYVKKTHSCPGCRKSGKVMYFFKEEDLKTHMGQAHPEMKLSSLKPDECIKYVTIRPKEDSSKGSDDKSSPRGTAENSKKRKNSEETRDGTPAAKKPKFVLPSEFTCAKTQCLYQSKDRADFKAHIQSHCQDPSLPQCEECGACFRIELALKRHLFIQHGIREFDVYIRMLRGVSPSPPPEETNPSPNPAQEISEQVSPPTSSAGVADKSTVLECQVCYKTFQNEGNLRTHMRNHGMAFIRSKRSASSD